MAAVTIRQFYDDITSVSDWVPLESTALISNHINNKT